MFQDGGYFGARHGGSLFIADCGAIAPDHLPAHGHGDVLAFEWTVGGQRLIVDAGVFEYERGPMRDLSRSSRSHNTLTLDDRDQAEFWAAFRVGRGPRVKIERFETLGRGFVLEGSHDGYRHLRGAPIHRRRFIVGRDSLVIADSVEGGARQSVEALLLHPAVCVEKVGPGAMFRIGSLAVLVETRHPLSIVDAHWWPNFGERIPTRQVVLHYPFAPCSGRFSLRRVIRVGSDCSGVARA